VAGSSRGRRTYARDNRGRFATTSPSEFIAETYAGLKTGRRYDFQVMRAYREAMGLSPNPAPPPPQPPQKTQALTGKLLQHRQRHGPKIRPPHLRP